MQLKLKRVTLVKQKIKLVRFLGRYFGLICNTSTICPISFVSSAQADWPQISDIKQNLITPVYT